MLELKEKNKNPRLELNKTDIDGLKIGIRKNGVKYSVRDDRSRFFFPNEWIDFIKNIKLELKEKNKNPRLELNKTDIDGLKIGIRKNGVKYSVRDDRSRFFFPNEWIDFIKNIKPVKRFLFETLIQTGARIEEALNIKPKDFDWDRKNLTLRVTKIKARKKESVGKARTFQVSGEYCRSAKRYILKNKIGEDELLFKVTKQAVYQMMRGRLKKSLEDYWNFSLHNIRKTHGNYLKALGIQADEICIRLGHDFDTYLKHYGSPNIFNRDDKILMIKILGDLYGFK